MQNLKIISYNTWLLRIPLLGASHVNLRRSLILQALLAENPDIICLQEVWHSQDIRFLNDSLACHGFHTHAAKFGVFGSGLYVASRFPIVDCCFRPSRAVARGAERLVTKGALKLHLKLVEHSGKTSDLTVLNLHLGAEVNRADRAVDIARAFEFALTDIDDFDSVIVAGDLAVDPFLNGEFCTEYQQIIARFGFQDVVANRKPGDFPTMLAQNRYVKPKWAGQSIDYVFYRGNKLIPTSRATGFLDQPVAVSNQSSIFLSDHVGVSATLQYDPSSR
jgi:endonuclease/exonuclease/phosphatase family metal-dependent hydrolase